jgi:hypothetical protein
VPGTNARPAIRAALCALLESEVDGLSALPYEPGSEAFPVPPPLVTMRSDLFSQDDIETGPVTRNVHGWNLRIWVALTEDGTPGRGAYESAQYALDALVPDVLSVVRKHPDIDGTCEWASVADSGGEVEFWDQAGQKYAAKSIQFRCEVFETLS